MDEPLTPTRLRERRQTPGLSPATLGVNSNMSNTTDRASRKKLPFVTSSTTSVNVASAMNRHLRSELDKENTTDPVLSSPTRPPSIWTNRFLRADMPQQESPSLIPIDNDEDDVLMNESAPGSIFGSRIRPSTIRRTPAPPAVPSTLRKEWTQSPSTTSTPSRFQSTLAYLGLSPKNSPSGSPNLNSPRVRRSARLRFKTPLRREVSEETEVVYEYRGDTLSGGRDLMPEFFGEHEIVQEPGWIFQLLEKLSSYWVFQSLIFPLFSWLLSLILIIGWGLYTALEFATIHFLAHPIGYIGQSLVTLVVKTLELTTDLRDFLISLVPVRKRGIFVLLTGVGVSSLVVVQGVWPKMLPGLIDSLTGWTLSDDITEPTTISLLSGLSYGLSSLYYMTTLQWLPFHQRYSDFPNAFQDTVDDNPILSKRLSRIESSLSALITRVKSLTQSQESKNEESKLDVLRVLNKALEELEKRVVVGLEERVTKLSAGTLSVDEVERMSDRIGALESQLLSFGTGEKSSTLKSIVESILSKSLAVQLDNGQVTLSPEFETYLSKGFMTSQQVSLTVKEEMKRNGLSISQVEDLLKRRIQGLLTKDELKKWKSGISKETRQSVQSLVKESNLMSSNQVLALVQKEMPNLLGLNQGGKDSNGTVAKLLLDSVQSSLGGIPSLPRSYGNGEKDYALSTLGGTILLKGTSQTFSLPFRSWLLSLTSRSLGLRRVNSKGPMTVLDPSLRPGDCWAMSGTQGQLRIRLGRKVIPKRLVLEHASVDSISSVQSAPKAIELWTVSEPPVLLLHSVFDPMDRQRSFPVTSGVLRDPVDVVELRVLSNWGQRDFTCVYHVGVFV